MDPVTIAIVGALAVGVAGGAGQVGKSLIIDAYDAVKAALKKKYGEDSDVVDAVARLEKKPDSNARQEVLQEEVEAVKADEEPEIRQAAQTLLDRLNALPSGAQAIQNIQNVYGDYSAVAGSYGAATVNVNQKSE